MKKIVSVASAIITCYLLSCSSNTGGMSDTAKKNLETARAIDKMFESGDWSKIGDYIATDAVDHAGMTGDVKGLDSIKASFAKMATMSGDMKNEMVKELADDDYVFQWMKESSTMKVDWMRMKAGSRNTFSAIEVSKFKDGKVTEHWSFTDWNDMMKMMTQAGAMGNMMDNKTDSAAGKTDKPK